MPKKIFKTLDEQIQILQFKGLEVNDIDKAQAGTVYKLSRVLGCTVEDLLESPEE